MAPGGAKRGWKPPTGAQLLLKKSAKECGLDENNLRAINFIPELYPDFTWWSTGGKRLSTEGRANLPEDDGDDDLMGNGLGDAAPTSSGKPGAKNAPPTATKLAPTTLYLIKKMREMQHRQQRSAYYLRPEQQVDVVRYKNMQQKKMTRAEELQATMGPLDSSACYIPQELLPEKAKKRKGDDDGALQKNGKKNKRQKDGKHLDLLAKKELVVSAGGGRKVKEEDDEEDVAVPATTGEGDDEGDIDAPVIEDDGEEEDAEDYIMDYYASEEEGDGGDADGGDEEPTF